LFDLEVVFTRRRANRNKKKVYLDILKKEGEKKKGGGRKKLTHSIIRYEKQNVFLGEGNGIIRTVQFCKVHNGREV